MTLDEVMKYLPDLRVAHQAIAETHSKTVRGHGSVAVILRNGIHVCGICSRNGIAFHALLWCDTPTIVNTKVDIQKSVPKQENQEQEGLTLNRLCS